MVPACGTSISFHPEAPHAVFTKRPKQLFGGPSHVKIIKEVMGGVLTNVLQVPTWGVPFWDSGGRDVDGAVLPWGLRTSPPPKP